LIDVSQCSTWEKKDWDRCCNYSLISHKRFRDINFAIVIAIDIEIAIYIVIVIDIDIDIDIAILIDIDIVIDIAIDIEIVIAIDIVFHLIIFTPWESPVSRSTLINSMRKI